MDFMMLGMLVGGVGGAIKNNSAGSVQQSCDDFNKQQETLVHEALGLKLK